MKRLLLVLLLLFVPRVDAAVTTGLPSLLGSLKGANLNSTADQAIDVQVGGNRYYITRILVTNASATPTLAAGGVYTAASKGGSAIVANSQAYSSLTAPTKVLNLTLAITDTAFSVSTLYLSLTTAAGSASTADVYVFGELLPVLAGEISLITPTAFTIQQQVGGQATINTAGTVRGEGGVWDIEGRFGNGAFTTVATGVSGSWSGSFVASTGVGSLDFRAIQGATVSNLRSITPYGVGDPLPQPGLIYFVGDSQTSFDGFQPITVNCLSGNCSGSGGTAYTYTNYASPGLRCDELSQYDAAVAAQYNPSRAYEQVVVLWCGTNDVGGGASAATAYSRLQARVSAYRTAGFTKILVLTALPRSTTEAARTALNDLIRAGAASDTWTVVDVGAQAQIGQLGDNLNPAYYAVDGVHLNIGGWRIVGPMVATAVFNAVGVVFS